MTEIKKVEPISQVHHTTMNSHTHEQNGTNHSAKHIKPDDTDFKKILKQCMNDEKY